MTAVLKVDIFTLFPEVFPGHLGVSILGKALAEKKWHLNVVNIRDFALDKHCQVDDTPYGGGPGMVMRADVIDRALERIYGGPNQGHRLIYMSPRGEVLTQHGAQEFSKLDRIGILCGRFEGIDERLLEYWGVQEVSIGDYVLTNGDIAAQVFLDSVVRLRPGIVGDHESLTDESFSKGLLEYPQFTRPREFKGMQVPDILLSGHHGDISKWRQEQSFKITKARRPDLLDKK